jgi:hypothetical protein
MQTRPLMFLGVLVLGGCIGYVHDDKIDSLKAAPVPLSAFAGVYLDHARYYTPPNATGLMGHATLGSAIRGIQFGADVVIAIDSAGDISVSAPGSTINPGVLHYANGRDFEFVDHRIIFKADGQFGSHDSPGIGGYKKQMQWMLDDDGRLVVVSASKGGGLMGIVPVAVGGSTLAIFDRAKKS